MQAAAGAASIGSPVEVDSDEEEEADVGDAKKQDSRYRSQDELDARSCAAEKKGEDFDELLDFIPVLDNKVREFELLIRKGMRKEQDMGGGGAVVRREVTKGQKTRSTLATFTGF